MKSWNLKDDLEESVRKHLGPIVDEQDIRDHCSGAYTNISMYEKNLKRKLKIPNNLLNPTPNFRYRLTDLVLSAAQYIRRHLR